MYVVNLNIGFPLVACSGEPTLDAKWCQRFPAFGVSAKQLQCVQNSWNAVRWSEVVRSCGAKGGMKKYSLALLVDVTHPTLMTELRAIRHQHLLHQPCGAPAERHAKSNHGT